MTKQPYFQQLLEFIGFISKNEAKTIYSKSYKDFQYTISVDFEKEEIDYPKPMILGDKTTSNFQASENFVVLECVNRLLEKGYKPENITLEKKWGLGHRDKGKADIFVNYPKSENENSEKAFLIIECKTWGKEFEHEFEKTQSSGGQLLSYYVQEPETRLLCLYSSTFQDNKQRYANRIIEAQADFKGKNKADIYKLWKDGNEQIVGQSFKYDGIFDEDSTPYNVVLKPLKRKNLVELQQGDSGYIYNQFAEILRHNVVSDKPNAFNKMFNLILAKIVDEDRPDEEELCFQWRDGDTDIELQKRLNDLYKKGMFEYLHKTVTDFSDDELDEELRTLSPTIQDNLRKRITELRLHKNNEFAFKEVFDENSFRDNAKVVRETVILLQNFQLRYSHKQQFLSNFFELLLSNTLKQEAGQFFTPVPVAKFIVSSLPLQEIIEQKIKDRKAEFLPTVIDYAAGSGHFLTEAMDEIQHIIQQIDTKNCTQSIKSNLESWKTENNAYKWADRFIYGIEKDYRLSKIAKVSCFLNGDGIANIIHADGLDAFDSEAYQEAPLLHLKKNAKNNPNFDVLVANPPYSVSAFIKTLARKEESFDLHDAFTEQSKEIECLFMERTKQIVKENGIVGIILPSSILNNAGVYTLAREIILKYFKIIAIVEFGSSTFMATGTNTITLFLRRRKDSDFKNIQDTIQQFFKDGNDTICNNIANAFSKYIQHVYQLELTDYVSFIKQNTNQNFKEKESYQDYEKYYNSLAETQNLKAKIEKLKFEIPSLKLKKQDEKVIEKIIETETALAKAEKDLIRLFYEKIFAIEQEKMLYFMLAYPQEVVLIKTNPTGNNDQEKAFLGYEFSNRRGHEGIKMFSDAQGNFTTKLYHETNRFDKTKASSYVYDAFLGKAQKIDESISENIQIQKLYEMMKFDRVGFEKEINISFKKKALIEIESKWELVRLGKIANFQSGLWKGEKEPMQLVKVIRNTNFITMTGKLDSTDIAEISVETKQLQTRTLEYGDIIVEKSGGSPSQPIGRVAFFDKRDNAIYSYSNFTSRLRANKSIVNPVYLWFYLHNFYRKGGTKSLQSGIRLLNLDNASYLQNKIPLPPKPIQEQIVSEILDIEAKENESRDKLEEIQINIADIVNQLFENNTFKFVKIISYFGINQKVINPEKLYKNELFTYVDIDSVSKGTNKINFEQKINGKNAPSRAKRIAEDNSIILSTVRPYLKGFAFISKVPKDVVFSTGFAIIKSKEEDDYKTLLLFYFFMYSKDLMKQMEDKMQKASYPSINKDDIDNFTIPLISIEAQNKIIQQITTLESQKEDIEQFLGTIQEQKEVVLRKYL
ncbi:hypothetical protein EMA8858_03432 [Emticicia aquatica]|uniref:Site-specific DNA-methyltransferase (adenine-specific) n=1 Tax=Emticicia aquatica TaxID=1681835 RepID=A0ABN8EX67_9BACT|nr:N-6 DNA methylase [Emticicia aquatica]CAH0997301.1 hypothetical protein EMA8858_03432 [Emticicia aquatica]